jgi:hypothetical protein
MPLGALRAAIRGYLPKSADKAEILSGSGCGGADEVVYGATWSHCILEFFTGASSARRPSGPLS